MDHLARAGCVVAVLLFSQMGIGADAPALQIQLEREGDAFAVSQEQDRTVLSVTSKTGIGRLKMTEKSGNWPKELTLRLCYAGGKAFTTLEGFEMTSSRLQIRCSSGQSRKAPFFLADGDGKFSRDDVNPTGWLNLEFRPHADDLDILFPAGLFRGEKEVRVQWIDYYRN